MSDLYIGLGNATVGKRGNFLPHNGKVNPCRFKIQIKGFLTKITRKSGPALIVEFDVIESGHEELKAPCERSQFISLKDKDVAFGNILQMLTAVCGLDPQRPEDVANIAPKAEALIKYITETNRTSNPLIGRLAFVDTLLISTRAGGEFTLHTWYPITEGQEPVKFGG